ncbi:MAG: heme-binding domain-containing protein [Planctomycetes bacterium]|nr:heme-binding domain-containing protein [Planctomycetota bacterium]
MKWKWRILLFLVVALVGMQFVPLDRSNPPVTGEIDAPEKVMTVLRKACYDCHSNEVKWPWYAYVAPMSFAVVHDVEEGREHVNFSEWDKVSAKKRAKIIEECWEEVEEGEMPLAIYKPLHPEAKLTAEDLEALKGWAAAYGAHDDD